MEKVVNRLIRESKKMGDKFTKDVEGKKIDDEDKRTEDYTYAPLYIKRFF